MAGSEVHVFHEAILGARESPGERLRRGVVRGEAAGELLDREIVHALKEAKILIENWRWEYNHFRPHSALGYRPPAPRRSSHRHSGSLPT